MAKSMNAKPAMKKPKAAVGKPPSKADKMPGYMRKAMASSPKGGKGC